LNTYTDSFGVTIAEGDIIYSGSSTGGQAKIGRAVFAPHSLMLEDVEYSADACRGSTTAKRVPCGSLRLVLMRADGSLPSVMHRIMNGEFRVTR
jgi:hypothetical protein